MTISPAPPRAESELTRSHQHAVYVPKLPPGRELAEGANQIQRVVMARGVLAWTVGPPASRHGPTVGTQLRHVPRIRM
jgi:hypothetical protein